MKKILILGLLLVSHLWGLKEWSGSIYSNREEWCLDKYSKEEDKTWCNSKTPTLPNDYKPTKEDKVLKVKVGNVEGEIIDALGKGIFIKGDKEKSYSFLASPSPSSINDYYLLDYGNYQILVATRNYDSLWEAVNFYQIFAVGDELKAFLLGDGYAPYYILCDVKDGDSPCPYTKNDVLDWIKKQGGQEYFDYACPQFYDDLNDICDQGIIRNRKCEEFPCNPFTGCPSCGNETEE